MAVLTSRFADGLAMAAEDADLVETAQAAARQALAGLSGPPDLVCFFICAEDPDDIVRAGRRVMELAGGASVIGCRSF